MAPRSRITPRRQSRAGASRRRPVVTFHPYAMTPPMRPQLPQVYEPPETVEMREAVSDRLDPPRDGRTTRWVIALRLIAFLAALFSILAASHGSIVMMKIAMTLYGLWIVGGAAKLVYVADRRSTEADFFFMVCFTFGALWTLASVLTMT